MWKLKEVGGSGKMVLRVQQRYKAQGDTGSLEECYGR